MFESKISAGATEKLPYSEKLGANISSCPVVWKVMPKKCVERYCELVNKTTQQLYEVVMMCVDDHQFKEEEVGSVGELSTSLLAKCSKMLVFPHW